MVPFGTPKKSFVTLSCILAAALGIISLANGALLYYNTIKGDDKAHTKIKQYIWLVLCIAYTVFLAVM